jgi:nucleoside-diphosphate-sugar epimerase
MTRTLLTGGSGFIAAHILDALLKRGHSVVTTVRSQEKAEQIKTFHPGVSKENLDFVIVPDVSAPDGSYLLINPYWSNFSPCELTVELYTIFSLRPGSRF